jgi:ParB-like chromosome segregation protein Spo0J
MAQIEKIPVMYIHTSPMNPRKTFDEAKIEELAQNIEEQGLLQPITVRKISDEETHIDEETVEGKHAKKYTESQLWKYGESLKIG